MTLLVNNPVCIIPGASSTSMLNGVENVLNNFSLDLKSWNLELNSDMRLERAVQYFSVLVTSHFDTVGKYLKQLF
jgi:hypothetical protein